MADPAAGKRSKLALHWKILIGLGLGVVVGVAVNVSWTRYTWGSLGVGDASAYLSGGPGELYESIPPDGRRALESLVEPLEVVGKSGPLLDGDFNAYTATLQMSLVSEFSGVDIGPGVSGDFEQAADWLLSELRFRIENFDSPDEATRRQARARIQTPDNLELASTVRVLLGGVIRDTAVWTPNSRAGFGASAAQFARHANDFVGDLFIRMLQFIAVPIVLFSLIVGAASLNDIKKLSRIGGKTMAIYLSTTALAITIGLLVANAVKPGSDRFVPAEIRDQLATDRAAEAGDKISAAVRPDVWETFLNIVPTNPFGALAEGNMLQVVFAAMAVGIALTLIPQSKAKPVIVVCDAMTDVIIKIVHVVMLTAPYAVFALIAGVVAELGLGVLQALAVYSLVVVFGLAFMMFLIYPMILRLFTPVGFKRFFSAIAPAQLLAFSSSSSSATLPVTMDCVENRLGASEDVTSFVVPLGATINMDGTALYQGVAAVFIAQLYGMDLSLGQQLTIVLTATLASIGTAGVPGVGMIMLVIVLQSINMSEEVMAGGIAIIFGVDRVLDMCRTTCNVTGDMMVAAVVASSEGELATPEELAARAEALDEFTKGEEEREKAFE